MGMEMKARSTVEDTLHQESLVQSKHHHGRFVPLMMACVGATRVSTCFIFMCVKAKLGTRALIILHKFVLSHVKPSQHSFGASQQPQGLTSCMSKTIRSCKVQLLPLGSGVGTSNHCTSVDMIHRKSSQICFIWLDGAHIVHRLIIKQDHIVAKSYTYFYCTYSCCAKQSSVPS